MRVYFIQAGSVRGPIKIGVSINPEARLRSLQTAHYETLVLIGSVPCEFGTTEVKLHRRVSASRIRGEWFRLVC